MASYPSPQRQPLLDQRLQQALNQRGKELLGLGLLGAGAVMALILGSYSPDDPSWMAASDGPVRNALGRAGAAIAAPVTIIMGKAGWGIVLAFLAWGLRLVTHRGEGNILGRTVFVPIAIALSAVWLATLVPSTGWALDFGMGGMFGDTVLGAVLTALPLTSTGGLNLLTLAFFVLMLGLWLYVLGSSMHEVLRFGRFLVTGLVLSYMGLLALLGGSARGMGGLARRAHGHWQDQREARHAALATPHEDWQGAAYQPPHQPIQGHIGGDHPATMRPTARVLRAEPPMAQAPQDYRATPAQPVMYAGARAPQPAPVQSMAPTAPESWEPPQRPGLLGPGLLARVLGRRGAEDGGRSTAEPQTEGAGTSGDDRIRSRISDVIRARQRQVPTLRIEPEPAP
ncbi:MAG TPA: hypothetical protein GX700_09200, partial [Paracoccus sp.]|nr:hypothetical protein [Paracoccus sp. (in: a-proteobacteria)]